MKIKTALSSLLILMSIASAEAHQTYLISDLYDLKPGTSNYLILRNGT